ncbi:MAG: hypothetical protein KDA92_22505, partial [Planctomycetales bacterium]|nr:hypothetical protein [Planctomycetales bacterium]
WGSLAELVSEWAKRLSWSGLLRRQSCPERAVPDEVEQPTYGFCEYENRFAHSLASIRNRLESEQGVGSVESKAPQTAPIGLGRRDHLGIDAANHQIPTEHGSQTA